MAARRRWLLVGAVALLGGALALLAAVHSSPARSWVRQRLIATLRASNVEARIDEVAYNALLLRVRLQGVGLAPARRPDAPFFEAEAVVVDLPWSWLLGGERYVQDIELLRPRLLVRADAEGTNLPTPADADAAPASDAGTGVPFVERLLIDEATIEWGDERADASLSLADLRASWSVDAGSIASGSLAASSPGLARWGPRSMPIDALSADLSFDGAALHFEDLSARLSFGTLSGNAHFALAEGTPRVEADLSGDFDVEQLAALVDVPALPSRGRLAATAKVDGRLADPSARIEITGRSIAWSSLDHIDADLTGLLNGAGASIESMRLRSADGIVEASGFVPFGRDAGGRVDIAWSGLEAGALVNALAAGAGPSLAATLDGDLTATWAGPAFVDPTLRAQTRASPGIDAVDRVALDGELSLEIDPGAWSAKIDGRIDDVLDVDGRAAGALHATDLLGSTLGGDVTVTVDALDTAAGRLADLGILDIRSPGSEESGDAAAFPLSGSVSSHWDLSGSLREPRGTAEITGEEMRFAAVALGDVDAGVDLDPSRLVVRALHASPAGGSADVELSLGFSTGTLDGEVHVEVPEVAELLADVPRAWRPHAALRLQASIAGTTENPAVEIDLEGGPLLLAGQTAQRFSATGGWSDGTLQVERFELLQAGNDGAAPGLLRGSASYRPDTGLHELRVVGERWHLQAFPPDSLSIEGVPVDARFSAQWESGGTLADPEVRATFGVAQLAYGGLSVGPLNAEVDAHDGLLELEANSNLLASGAVATVGLDPWGDFTLSVMTDGLDLLRVRDHFDLGTIDVTGNVSFGAEASGNFADPAGIRATLELRELDAAVEGTPLRLVDAGLIALEAGELRADPIDVRWGGTSLRLRGRSGGAGELQVDLNGDLGEVVGVIGTVSALAGATAVGVTDAPASDLGVEARGDVALGLRVSGSIDAPEISGFVDVTDGEVTLPDFPGAREIRLAVRLRNGALEIDQLGARWQGATLSATGLVPLGALRAAYPAIADLASPDDARAARLSARVDSVTPAVLAPFVDEATTSELGGALSARLDIETDDLSLAAAHGDIVIEELALRVAGADVGQRVPTRVRLAAGALNVEQWTWVGPAGEVTVAGSVQLEPQPALALTVLGDVDLRVLRAAFPGVATAGRAQLSFDVSGPARAPGFDGSITVVDGELRVAAPRFALTGIAGTVDLDPRRIVIERISGLANGGTFSLTGEIAATDGVVDSGTLRATAEAVALEPLRGLGTLLDADLRLDIGEPMTVRGDVTVRRGEYRERLSATSGLLAALQQQRQEQLSGVPVADSALDDLRLDVRIDSTEGLLVDNNLARLTADLDLVLSGTVARPALGGRIELREGGTVFLSGNRFRLEEGAIDFVDPESIQPDLDVNARARISTYDVDLAVSGTPDTLDVALSSTPELDQSDLVSLVVTGHTLDEAGSMPTQVARDQVLGLLTAEVSGRAGRAIGLDSVRIERGGLEEDYRFDPSVVAPETDPGSRLSLYKSLRDDLDLVYSQSLKDSGKFTWIVGYRFLRNFSLRWLIDDDNSRAYELSQDLGFGAPASAEAPGRQERLEAPVERVREIRLEGTGRLDEASVRERLRLRRGDRFDYFRWQDDRDRLERLYQESGYLEARIAARRSSVEQTGDSEWLELAYDIDPGPQTVLRFEGRELGERARRDMEEAWTHSVFDGFLVDELEAVARRELADDGYVSPRVEVRIETSAPGGTKTAVVSIAAGERPGERRIEFHGNDRIGNEELSRAVHAARLESRGWADRAALQAEIAAMYRQRGMIDATVEVGDPEHAGPGFVLPVTIDEGAAYEFADLILAGVAARDPDSVRSELGLSRGDPFATAAVDEARRAVEASYRSAGFAHARVQTSVVLDVEAGAADVTFAVDEGQRQVLAEVVVTGAARTRPGVIDRSLRLKVGEPLDPADVYNARQRLYQTGVFRRVDMVVEPIELAPATAAGDTISPTIDTGQEPVRLLVRLQERAPFRLRYGVRVNDTAAPATDTGRDIGLGFSSDLSDRNVFGHAATASVSLRYQADFRAVRGFFGTRSLLGLPVASNVYVTRSHEEFGQQDVLPFVADRSILTLEQRLRPSSIVGLAYSFNFERNHTFDPEADPDDPFAFDISVDIAVLRFSTFADTRDDVLDAHRGWSHSSTIDYAVPLLGSDLRYVKYLLQQTYFHPLPGNVVLASAARLGLATSFEDELIPSERFFAGGGNSVRGYPEDSLGPEDFFGAPLGGEALLLFKQEVRFPVWRWFRGVGFFDAGNAFESVRDIALSDLAASWGLGVRVHTPFVLLRVDYGFRLGRNAGEPRGRFFFSIGQSF